MQSNGVAYHGVCQCNSLSPATTALLRTGLAFGIFQTQKY